MKELMCQLRKADRGKERDWERVRQREMILEGSRDDGTAEEQFNRMELPIMLKTNLSRKTDY